MKNARLLSTVTATVLLSAGVAFAQAPAKDRDSGASSPAPAAQQNAPAEKTAPSMKAGQPNAETHKAPGTTGQAPAHDTMKPGNPDKATNKGSMDKGSMDKSTQNAPAAAPNAVPKASGTEQRSTTGQGSASGAAKLSTEQRTKITTVFKQQKVERVDAAKLNISINVGTRVPSSVHFYPIPQEVVVIYPEWRGFDYILVGDQIVVLDPHSHAIVAIMEA
ncbi:MAG TPA: DUF1236 domain-containing protein [Pseudolabrys sp.]|jgi:hypothetical protein